MKIKIKGINKDDGEDLLVFAIALTAITAIVGVSKVFFNKIKKERA